MIQFIILFICAVSSTEIEFPKEFIFGAATSAYQIEGGWNASGKTPSYWDVYAHKNPHLIKDGSNGDVACDSYHKYKEDVKILSELGVSSYRFSISWTRLLPHGYANRVNYDGLRYYNSLIDELLNNNITPMVTLYHWDMPDNFTGLGGFTNPIIADLFVEYADVAFKYFGDRVKMWSTFNEPHSFCTAYGVMIPENVGVEYLCIHNMLRAHGKAYRRYKSRYSDQQGLLGIVLDSQFYYPATNSIDDKKAADRAIEYDLNWMTDPIFSETGDYSPFLKDYVANISRLENFASSKLPSFTPDEIEEIRGSADYMGFNHYRAHLTAHAYFQLSDMPSFKKDLSFDLSCDKTWRRTSNGWCEYPQAFYDILMHIKTRYNNPPVYITENGVAEFEFNDIHRQSYFKRYLQSLSNAIKDGANILGYYAWSLMDNWEWSDGYTQKFGLYYVNFTDPDLQRIPKPSAIWYQQLIKTHKQTHDN